MQFLKTLFWVILAVVIVIFGVNNWETASISLWDGLRLDTKLPVLIIGAFLVGFVPLWLVFMATRWRLKRRIATLESAAQHDMLDLETGQIAPTGAYSSSDSDGLSSDPDGERDGHNAPGPAGAV